MAQALFAKLCTSAGLSCNDLSQMCSLSQQLTPFLNPHGLQNSNFHALPDTVQWQLCSYNKHEQLLSHSLFSMGKNANADKHLSLCLLL